MSSNRIFASKVTESQGRSANLPGNMFKRAPIFTHVASEKQEPSSPFANYNCRSAESLQSQDRLTVDAVMQLIKEECSKVKNEDQGSKKLLLTLQAQLKDIRLKLTESENESAQKLQDFRIAIKAELKEEVAKMGKEVDEEISSRLRLFFQKVNLELKKDILKVSSEEFLSFSYGQDLQNRLQAMSESIQNLNSLIKTKELSSQQLQKKLSSINVNEKLQSKLLKIEKEAEGLKKSLSEYTVRTKQLQEWKQTELSKSIDLDLKEVRNQLQKVKQEQTHLLKPVQLLQSKSSSYDSALDKLQNKLQQAEKNCEEVKEQLLDLTKKVSCQEILFKRDSTQVKPFENDLFQTSIVIANNSDVYKKELGGKKSSGEQLSQFAAITVSNSVDYEEARKSVYQVDSEGFLMDGDRRYILTESGTMIQLSGEQIAALMDSKLIEVL